jgi:DNA adenine methylase
VLIANIEQMKLVPFNGFLSWPGGKRRMLKYFESLFPETCLRYYEPFLGGGAVALAIAPYCEEMVLSDKNRCLINAWQCVRENPEAIALELYYHKHRHERGGRGYFDYMRDLYNDKRGEEGIEAASRFIFLNKSCFNGSWRSNKKGRINITLGTRCYVPLFEPVADRLAGDVALVACEFDIIDSAERGDLIYLDPPYYEGHREIASEYGIGRFTEDDRARMVNLAARASSRGARIVGSDIDCPYTRALYEDAGFVCDSVSFVYCIGGHQKSRAISSELIYHNKL